MLTREQTSIQEKLQSQMAEGGFDALILTLPESVYYATGMPNHLLYATHRVGTCVAVVPKTGRCILICDAEDVQGAVSICRDVEIQEYSLETFSDGKDRSVLVDPDKALRIAYERIRSFCSNPQRIGIEWQTMPYDRMMFLISVFGRDVLADGTDPLFKARAVKTPWEISVLKDAAQATDRAMYETCLNIDVGMTEEDVLYFWNKACFNQGSRFFDRHSVHTFADQHTPVYIPRTFFRLKEGDLCKLDGTLIHKGYVSDLARVFSVGKYVDPKKETIYELLLRAQDAAFEMAGPGVRMSDVYRRCLGIIQSVIPEFTVRNVGHSIGCSRFPTEQPVFNAYEDRQLEPNMVFCIEITYCDDSDSTYTLEDMMVITEDGVDRFTAVPRTLLRL
ncbi:MAG: Xaa-Pro peptidase family protein [Clostridiales Family XIII bacterium]|nr:Xaa-Pro peptidase family protein [Clostridiales Family XIII bacterium]